LSRPYIGGGNTRLPGKSSTRCIRFAQHATDLAAPSIPLGRRAVSYWRGSAKMVHSIPFHSGADLSRPYIGGGNTRLPGKSSTTCIRFAQHATDLGVLSIPLGRQWVYCGRGSAEDFHSIPFRSCDEWAVRRIFVKTGDIPTTTMTLTVRVLQQATDPFMRNHFLGRQWVYYERGSDKEIPSKTLPCCDESPVNRIFVKTGDISTTTLTGIFE
jgi:hypothetical protein